MSKRTLLLPVPPMSMRHNSTPAASPARNLSEKLARLEATACVRRLSALTAVCSKKTYRRAARYACSTPNVP